MALSHRLLLGTPVPSSGLCVAWGHQTRHFTVLMALHEVMRSVWGGNCIREPSEYRSFSDHRPDIMALFAAPGYQTLIVDLKIFDPIGSDGVPDLRGALVAFGNTLPEADALVHGHAERGVPSDGPHKPRTGAGYVKRKDGDYARAKGNQWLRAPRCAHRELRRLLAGAHGATQARGRAAHE